MGRFPAPGLYFFLPLVVEEAGRREPQASYSNGFDAVDRLIQLTSDKLPKYLRLAGRTTP
jgi:hypothetical protein